ncbi:MAG TPA: hypothetical protein PKA79_01210 [Oligoflexia bacterium]|nr:hypothetical protein [Oligoflexia bacterium]
MFDRELGKKPHNNLISLPHKHTLLSPVYGEHSSGTLYFWAALVEAKFLGSSMKDSNFMLSDHLSIVSDLATYPDYFGNHQRPRTPFYPTLTDYRTLNFATKIDLKPTSDPKKNLLTCAQIADHLLIACAFSNRENDFAINTCRWFYKSADFYVTEAIRNNYLSEEVRASSPLFRTLASGIDGAIAILREVIFEPQK